MVDTMTTLIQSISTVGFPIVMCLIMVYLNNKQDEKHELEMKEITKAVENNTQVMIQLIEKLTK